MNPGPLDLEAMQAQREQLLNPPQPSLMQMIRADKNRSALATLWRAFTARTGPGGLSRAEYVKFATGDLSAGDLRLFAGAKLQHKMHAACNDPGWFAVTKHKLLFETLMKGAGLPVPATIAAYDRKGRGSGTRMLASRQELESFLLEKANYPLFCKPTTGVNSLGVLLLDIFKHARVRVNGGACEPVEKVANFIDGFSAKGYLFQKPLKGDAAVAALTGDAGLVSLRFVVLQNGSHSHIQACVAKLPAAGEVADNFWRGGAVMCALAPEDGTVTRAVTQHEDRVLPVQTHPHTGNALQGRKFPGFDAARQCVLQAAPHLSAIATQSWDVALTRTGPVLLEVNFGGDLNLIQIAGGRGILDKTYCAHLRNFGYAGALPF